MQIQSVEDWTEKLKKISSCEGVVVLVEGKNDQQKLKKLGIKNIYPLKGKKFYDVLEELENSSLVIILTDLDKQGEKIFKKISSILKREGVPTDGTFRLYLKNLGIKYVEEIPYI